jgi:hypothetical protein
MKNHLFKLLAILVLTFLQQIEAQQPAFPGAQGHGRYTSGGRGGDVYYVTSLDDTITFGTLRYGLENSAMNKPRTIMFKVSGTIHLTNELKVRYGNVTVAGQSAPGDGITLRGYPVSIAADNVILRYLRFRMGDLDSISADGSDALGGRSVKNIIVDHCSLSWSTDECGSFYQNQNFTLQWSILSESLRLSKHAKGAHGYGGIWGGTDASFLHNLVANHDSRNPRFGPSSTSTIENERVDMRNNVIYNWCSNSSYGGEAMHINIVDNYYKPGPASPTGSKRGRIMSIDKKTDNSMPNIQDKWGTFYISGNVVDDGKNDKNCNNATNDNWTYGVLNQFHGSYGAVPQSDIDAMRRSTPVPYGVVYGHTARVAYQKVLDLAGSSLSRDAVDSRIVNEVATGTTTFTGKSANNVSPFPKPGIIDSQEDLKPEGAGNDWSAWPVLNSLPAPSDSDGDGMPDAWETANGLNPNNSADGKTITASGYSNLELYLNSLVSHITAQQMADVVTSVKQVELGDRVRVYPNPSSGRNFSIDSSFPISSVRVYDMSGRLVNEQHLSGGSNSFSLASLGRGVYLLSVKGDSGMKETTVKLMLK